MSLLRKSKKIIGIYKIENLLNAKVYIGQSTDCFRRWLSHKKIYLKRNSYLYQSIKKYGIENFKFEILKECKKEDLDILECFFIRVHYSWDKRFGYNLTFGGTFGKVIEEKRKQAALSQKEFYKNHPEIKEKLKITLSNAKRKLYKDKPELKLFKEKNPMYGQHWAEHPEWSKNSCFLGMKKERHPLWGKHHKEETKQKIREKHLGIKASEETKLKFSKIRIGKHWFNDGKRDYFMYEEKAKELDLKKGRLNKGWDTHPKKEMKYEF